MCINVLHAPRAITGRPAGKPMKEFKKILELPAEEIRKLAREDPHNEELFTALVLKKFMEKYHLRDVDTALEQFMMFKKAQSRMLSLSEEEEKALEACLRKIKTRM
jgi:hypothetical protein